MFPFFSLKTRRTLNMSFFFLNWPSPSRVLSPSTWFDWLRWQSGDVWTWRLAPWLRTPQNWPERRQEQTPRTKLWLGWLGVAPYGLESVIEKFRNRLESIQANREWDKVGASTPQPNFIKLLSRKYCLTNFFAKQTLSVALVTTMWTRSNFSLYLAMLSNNVLSEHVFVLTGFINMYP